MNHRTDASFIDTSLSIVIPAYNESLRISTTLGRICDYMQERGQSYEVLVVDDGSEDDTEKVVRKVAEKHPAIVLLQNDVNKGKGYSVKRGVLSSRGRFIIDV